MGGGAVDAVQALEGEVRELIRRSGLDPARDEGEVRRLVREAVADCDERSMLGGMPVIADVDAASRTVWVTVAGAGAGVPFVGGVLTALPYWAMVRIGRLPEDERVLR